MGRLPIEIYHYINNHKANSVIFQINLTLFFTLDPNLRTNGPVNAHLRSGIYTNKLV